MIQTKEQNEKPNNGKIFATKGVFNKKNINAFVDKALQRNGGEQDVNTKNKPCRTAGVRREKNLEDDTGTKNRR